MVERNSTDGVEFSFDGYGSGLFAGHVFDRRDVSRNFDVEIAIDGALFCRTAANLMLPPLAHVGLGDGRFGFAIAVPAQLRPPGFILTATIATTVNRHQKAVGFAHTNLPMSELYGMGEVRLSENRFIEGWVFEADVGMTPVIDVHDGDRCIGRVAAQGWGHVGGAPAAASVRTFAIAIRELADFTPGRPLRFSRSDGAELLGSPLVLPPRPNTTQRRSG